MKHLIEKAVQFATKAHSGQCRKGTEIPYILHPLEAGAISASLTTHNNEINKYVVAASILHDTIEDTNITEEILADNFPSQVVELVKMQSEDKSKSWQERKEHTINMLKYNKNKNVEILLLADKLANLRSIAKDYEVYGDDIWERFNKGKVDQAWYYSSIAQNISQLKDTKEYKEYISLLEIFH